MSTSFTVITSDGTTTTNLSNLNVFLEQHDMQWMPRPQVDMQIVPTGSGASQGINFDGRIITLNCICVSSTPSNLRSDMDSVAIALDPELGDQTFKIDQFPDRQWNGRVISPISGPFPNASAFQFTVQIECVDPIHGESQTETNTSYSITTDPDAFSINPGGTHYAYPIWYVRNETGGNETTIAINNATTGETVTWGGTLADDKWLKIDSNTEIIYVSDSTGSDPEAETYTVSMSDWQAGSVFPRLRHNVSNTINVTGIETGTLTPIFRARYK